MYLILRHANGKRSEALILALGPESMRIAIRGRSDTMELRREGEKWLNEEGGPVTIEAILAAAHQEGLQTNTKNSAAAVTSKTAAAAMTSSAAGLM